MERAKLSRTIERLLRCAEDIASACAPVDGSSNNKDYNKMSGLHARAVAGFEKDRERYSHLTQTKKVAAVARDWLDAYQDAQVFDKLPALLAVVQHRAEAVARSPNSPMHMWVPVLQPRPPG